MSTKIEGFHSLSEQRRIKFQYERRTTGDLKQKLESDLCPEHIKQVIREILKERKRL